MFVHRDDATLFSYIEENAKLLVIAADICIKNPTISTLFHA